MTFWTAAFCEICYRANRFAEAHKLMQLKNFRNYQVYAKDLAAARMNLECAKAVYQAEAKQHV